MSPDGLLTAQQLLALAAFALATSITPGPNNLMLMASGVTFGLRRTVPHMLGVGIGFAVMIAAVGLGLGAALREVPGAEAALKIAGAAYLLWLAWRVANAGPVGGGAPGARPMTFLGAAAFQWVNPKAWAMALAATALYAPPGAGFVGRVLLVALVFGVVNLPSVSAWAGFGVALRGLLTDPRRARAFNLIMAGLLVASLVPMLA